MILRPLTSTLFPYTTLFRSLHELARTRSGFEDDARPGVDPNELARHVMFNEPREQDRKSTRLNSSHVAISYAVFCLKKKKKKVKNQHEQQLLDKKTQN